MVVGEEGPLKSSTSDFMHGWSYQTPSRNGGGGSGRSLGAGPSGKEQAAGWSRKAVPALTCCVASGKSSLSAFCPEPEIYPLVQ